MNYNGWSNRETWLINAWYNPKSREMLDIVRSLIEEQYDEMYDGPLKDMIDLNAINWNELKSALDDEE